VQPDPVVADEPSITLASGEVLYADLIVGTDGAGSILQEALTGLDDRATPTGEPAYRADLMLEDPELRPSVEMPHMVVWVVSGLPMGACCIARVARETAFLTSSENRVGYRPVEFYPDDRSVESWTEEGTRNKVHAGFADFESRYVPVSFRDDHQWSVSEQSEPSAASGSSKHSSDLSESWVSWTAGCCPPESTKKGAEPPWDTSVILCW
jgi:2-polyprenyl-6-methoxyphenol hydroxylase-like FAD-dependent oxidoreductase